MRGRRLRAVVWVAARLTSATALLSVAAYYLLASVPFSYYHFLQFAHFWWLPGFIAWHPALMALGSGVLLLTLGDVPVRWRLRLLLAVGVPTLWMAVTVMVPVLQTYENAMAMCAVPLAALGLASALDLAAHRSVLGRSRSPQAGAAEAVTLALLAGLLAGGLYLGRADIAATAGGIQGRELLLAGLCSLGLHLALFAGGAMIITAMSLLVSHLGWPAVVRWGATGAFVACFLTVVLDRALLGGLMLDSTRAVVLAAVVSVVLVTFWHALVLPRAVHPAGEEPIELGWLPVRPAARTQWIPLVASAAAIGLCLWVLPRQLLLADWGLTLQKLLALATWTACLVLVRSLPIGRGVRLAVAGGVVSCLAAFVASAAPAARSGSNEGTEPPARDMAMVMERYAAVDTSLAVVLDLARAAVSDRDFYAVLRKTGDVTDSPQLAAVPFRLAPARQAASPLRPHIIVIVVDSLRPDYLGPYNSPAAAFTPQIDAFARESVVMRQAFTPYAGTALAEAAVWAGGLIPRANYAQPFSNLNNLERLLAAGRYRSYVSMDQILGTILGDRSQLTNLEPQLAHPEAREEMFKFDLCTTVDEMRRRLTTAPTDGRPIFMYSQPQNLHIRVLASSYPVYEGVRIGGGEFFKPAVDALRRVDGCFGALIRHLKSVGMYDDTIVVLTADHGDSYGEEGRWGHAFYVTPEIIRIPLIMHVPERLLRGRTWDADRFAFLTDVTPTLYDLLGYGYQPSTALAGRPLIVAEGSQQAPVADAYLMQSSYSRAFGLLDGRGRWLYVANANHVKEELFDMVHDPKSGTAPISPAERVRLRRRLLDGLEALNAYYAPGAH